MLMRRLHPETFSRLKQMGGEWRSRDVTEIERARDAYRARAWTDAHEQLRAADAEGGLEPADLQLLAVAANMAGDPAECERSYERAHHAWLHRGEPARAIRCAFWLGIHLQQHGERARAGGWFSRAARLLDEHNLDCVEHGYLHLPGALRSLGAGDVGSAATAFEHTAAIATRFADPDLVALARTGLGQCLVSRGEVAAGMSLLDEVMVAVMASETSLVPSGIIYCTVIVSCQQVYDVRRAQEWTAALDRWTAGQQGMVPFRGQCLMHRSEIMQLHGEWPDALAEAQRAVRLLSEPRPHPALGAAWRQLAELQRLRGELPAAEESFRAASLSGSEPQPGFALLRLAQGRADAAHGSIRRALDTTRAGPERRRLLPAYVDVALAAGELDAARDAADELARLAEELDAAPLHAAANFALGRVRLASGDPSSACEHLRRALHGWQEIDAPYEVARVRAQLAVACTQLGDSDSAELELDAATAAFQRLGAAADLAALPDRTPSGRAGHAVASGLTERESEVLGLAAQGRTNREIATRLVLSEHTVRRHLQNIFAKLDVPSRAAAAAWYERTTGSQRVGT